MLIQRTKDGTPQLLGARTRRDQIQVLAAMLCPMRESRLWGMSAQGAGRIE
jgi:hypothetical protein